MRLTQIALVLAAGSGLIVGPARVRAAEHPEHPNGAKQVSIDSLEKAIKEKVADKTKEDGGTFKLPDDVLDKTWELDLVKVHRDKLARLEDGRYFACVDMKSHGGSDVVDVDFFLTEKDGTLAFSDMAVHKVNGVARYGWEKKGDTWIKTPAAR
ncbi:MAG TPA: hypothetical protein VKH46_03985 [Thermoanaerobaculia bacterium]|jgi:hypothetical protein|nr:hypothetical protein [Thermoanaerobaculia bacterium]